MAYRQMSGSNNGPDPRIKNCDRENKIFNKVSGILALTVGALQIGVVIISICCSNPAPNSTADWFTLLQKNSFLGYLDLGIVDAFSVIVYCPLFIAIYMALKVYSETLITAGTVFAFIGIAIYLGTIPIFSIINLSGSYAAAANDIVRNRILAAGETVLSIGGPGTGSYMAFFIMGVGGLLVSAVMYRDEFFGKTTAVTGILANFITLVYYMALVFSPAISIFIMWLSGLTYLAWTIMTGLRLLFHKAGAD